MSRPVVISFCRTSATPVATAVSPPVAPPVAPVSVAIFDTSCPPSTSSSLSAGKNLAKEYLQQSVKISTRNQVLISE